MEHIIDAAIGGGIIVGGYLVYVAATKGVPAAWAKVKAWWTAGEVRLAKIERDIASLQAKVGA
jgi:hypothetical protein